MDWEGIAKDLDFESSRDMLNYWYVEKRKSIKQIGDIIGISSTIIETELKMYGILIRGKKRGKILGLFRCRHCGELFEGDVRMVCCHKSECRALEDILSKQKKSEITKRGLERKKNTNNHCVNCGKDKGINRWYCPDCLSVISSGMLFE